MATMQLRRLGPEPWGDRMTRARVNAGFNVRQVEEILFPHISKSALIRLEAMQELPDGRKDRARTALVLLLYGYDFEEFGVSETDLPPVIDMRALDQLRRRNQGKRGSWCIHASEMRHLRLAA